ncbi:MAG: GtrA family protein [Planctomycetota bacterium]|nr:GtrA family protein [Planctomycetota bacterium]
MAEKRGPFRQLRALRRQLREQFGVLARFGEFCTVGLVGATIYLTVISLLDENMPLHLAAFGGGIVGLISVYSINRQVTFDDRERRGWWRQLGEYALVNSAGFVVNWMITTHFGTQWRAIPLGVQGAACIGIVVGAFFNFTAAYIFVFRK